jgi:hypothetical protein
MLRSSGGGAMSVVPATAGPITKDDTMDLNLIKSTAARKSQRLVIYTIEGRRGSVQFLSTLFGGDQTSQGNPRATLVLRGEFAKPEADEERKARLANRPKLTEVEKIANLEAQLAKRKAALTTGSSTPTPTPTAPPTARAPKAVIAAKGKKPK